MTIQELYNRNFDSEFNFKTSKSSGPGGQHVNKVSSKVELRFDIRHSQILTDEEKEIIEGKLAHRLTSKGTLIIIAQLERSQLRNKQIAIEKFYEMLSKALQPVKKRKPTKPTRASKEERLENKRKSSEKKARRRNIFD
ncbi:MAG: alternative ribosome rescue aminoacyl-tRNA hydrolase ArfB [Marinifilaceae bacterium]